MAGASDMRQGMEEGVMHSTPISSSTGTSSFAVCSSRNFASAA